MRIGRVYANFQEDFFYTEHYLAKELLKENHETVFITSDKYLSSWSKYLKTKDRAGFRNKSLYAVHRLKAWNPGEKVIYKNPFKLWRLLFNSGFDVLHLNAVGSFSTITVLWMVLLKGKKAPPVIINDHTDTRTHTREGFFADFYYYFLRFNLYFTKSKIKKIITFAEIGKNLLSERFQLSPSLFQIIPLGFDQDNYKFEPQKHNIESCFRIGYAGKISAQKRVDLLMDTLEGIASEHKIILHIVGMKEGDPYCESLKTKALKLNYEVKFSPFANPQELNDFYNFINLAVYPGGISITTIEASACGVPIIVYKSISGLETRVDDNRGRLFNDTIELIDFIKYYIANPANKEERLRISESTTSRFSWSNIKNNYLEIYKKAINEK